jgi:hypothetical protein
MGKVIRDHVQLDRMVDSEVIGCTMAFAVLGKVFDCLREVSQFTQGHSWLELFDTTSLQLPFLYESLA